MFGDRRKRRRRPAGLSGLGDTHEAHLEIAEGWANRGWAIINEFEGSDLPCRTAFRVYRSLVVLQARAAEALDGSDFGNSARELELFEAIDGLEDALGSLAETLSGCLGEDGVIGMWTADSQPPPPPTFRVIRGGKS